MSAKEKQGFSLYFLIAFGLAWLCQVGGCMALLQQKNAVLYQLALIATMFCPLLAVLLVQKVFLRQPVGIGWKVQGKRRFWLAAWFGPAVFTLLGAVLYFAVFPSRLDFSGSWLVAAYGGEMDAQTLRSQLGVSTLSYLLQNVALLIFGANAKAFTSVVSVPALKLADGQINITGETIVTIVTCLIIMAGLMFFINKTKAGQAMLAVSEDKGAAQLMGINVDGTIALTFAIGSGLAAVAGVLLCSAYPSLTPYTGSMPGIKAFVAAVFGGIGSIPGALVGGILLGIIEIFGKAYISSQMADAIVFAVLIVVLLVKPAGLFGKNIQEKV